MAFQEMRWALDVLDILIVAFFIYHIFLLVRGTRAAQMFLGLVAIVLLSALADLASLSALNWLLASLKTVWVVAFLIIFQPELRRGLSMVGNSRLFRRIFSLTEVSHLSEIQTALVNLRKRGLGAILVLERNTGLRGLAEAGTMIEANLTAELIETIFTPPSPLHDGAVILRGNQIVAAGCILPLSQNPAIDRSLGTRHRAILGVSEETDALAIAVSEESRQISIAEGGLLIRNVDPNALKEKLSQFVRSKEEREEKASETPKKPKTSAPKVDAEDTDPTLGRAKSASDPSPKASPEESSASPGIAPTT